MPFISCLFLLSTIGSLKLCAGLFQSFPHKPLSFSSGYKPMSPTGRKAESWQSGGQQVRPLSQMHWRLASFPRLCFVARERSQGELEDLMRCCVHHVGDTALIENVHKEAKVPQLHQGPALLQNFSCFYDYEKC